ncbi:MAG: bifunctional 5,10-methylenetetrahydrofolate dehydrogenase/5,10-methenyltetrahydrofolate cyclohydrolase [Candidatus Moraniibacteriota bacterium]
MALLYGKPVADKMLAETQARIAAAGVTPGLAVILVGDDPASHIYVGLKEKAAGRIGMLFEKRCFPADTAEDDIIAAIGVLNRRGDIHGIIVQLPLPAWFDTDRIIAAIAPDKDADGFHQETLARLSAGDKNAYPVLPLAVLALLRATRAPLAAMSATVIVNSALLGKVMTQVLRLEGMSAEFILPAHIVAEQTRLKNAAIVVSACGIPDLLQGSMLRHGAVVIDAGIVRVGGMVVGDADQESVGAIASFLTPVPGGVGPVTVATLLARVTAAALRKKGNH